MKEKRFAEWLALWFPDCVVCAMVNNTDHVIFIKLHGGCVVHTPTAYLLFWFESSSSSSCPKPRFRHRPCMSYEAFIACSRHRNYPRSCKRKELPWSNQPPCNAWSCNVTAIPFRSRKPKRPIYGPWPCNTTISSWI